MIVVSLSSFVAQPQAMQFEHADIKNLRPHYLPSGLDRSA